MRAVAWLRQHYGEILLLLTALPTLLSLPEYPARKAAELIESRSMSNAGLSGAARLAFEKDLLLYETDQRIKIWTAIVQAIGGGALLIGLLFSWRNLRAAQLELQKPRTDIQAILGGWAARRRPRPRCSGSTRNSICVRPTCAAPNSGMHTSSERISGART